jgi:hypothetical protein
VGAELADQPRRDEQREAGREQRDQRREQRAEDHEQQQDDEDERCVSLPVFWDWFWLATLSATGPATLTSNPGGGWAAAIALSIELISVFWRVMSAKLIRERTRIWTARPSAETASSRTW